VQATISYYYLRLIREGQRLGSLPLLPLFVVLLLLLPVAVVGLAVLTPSLEIWSHLWQTILPEMLRNTLLLVIGVGFGTFIIGTGLAWLMVAYRFPGQSVLEWLLILPMAVPTYVMGFVYMATFDFAGPVQSFLRQWFGEIGWFPEIRSGAGAIVVMTLVLYPYVYLLARAGFREQSGNTLDAARMLGHGSTTVFFRVVLPLARPSIAAGVALAVMEALADFATVRFFNFPTLSDGVIRIWHGMMDLRAASELAGMLAVFALFILLLEHNLRGRSRYYQVVGKTAGITRVRLSGWRGWMVTAVCLFIVAVAIVLPIGQLSYWGLQEIGKMQADVVPVYINLALNSLLLAGLAAIFATAVALFLSSRSRISRSKTTRGLTRLATIGYAIPGAVIGVGILLPLSALDHALNNFLEAWRGITVGLIFTGSLIGLTYAYVTRFLAVSYNSVDASMEKVTVNITQAARILGAGNWKVMRQIHLPLVAPGMMAGAILVFVDVMKELPITVILRPFGYDTLAIWVWQMAAESLWAGASLPALAIVLVGILPVIILMRADTRRGKIQ